MIAKQKYQNLLALCADPKELFNCMHIKQEDNHTNSVNW